MTVVSFVLVGNLRNLSKKYYLLITDNCATVDYCRLVDCNVDLIVNQNVRMEMV